MRSLNSFHSIKRIILLALCLLIFLCGCTVQPQTDTHAQAFYTFTDGTNATVVLPQKPQNCAVLFSSFAQIWTRTGGDIAVTVGEAVERGFADETALLVDRGAGKSVDEEILLAAGCDFVIGSADIPAQVNAIALLRKKGIPCALFSVENFGEYLSVLRIFADINQNEAALKTDGTVIRENINNLFDRLPQREEEPRILFIRSGSSASSCKAKGTQDHFAAAMLEELGAHNIADDVPMLTDCLSMEEVLLQDPDKIFISCMGDEEAAKEHMESVLQSPQWQKLTAVQNGEVYFLPKDLFQYKPNHRWDEAYEYLISVLYS